MRNLVRKKLSPIWLTYRICSPILKLTVCSSFFFFLLFFRISTCNSLCCVLLFGKFCFLSYIFTLFFFLPCLDFWIKAYLQDMTCLNLIGHNKGTMPLIASNYPPANIILEATIMRRFVKFCVIGVLIKC